ncbi:MAG: YfhO family protein, partial [Ruminococcaceae bacterium]|nr:YfhO family protein [Oscillospiraceae bacterium]
MTGSPLELSLNPRRRKNAARLFSFAVPAVIALAACVYFGFAPFGKSSILTGDLNGTYLAYLGGYKDMLLEGKSLFFTFSKQLGGSLYNIFIPYLFTPLDYLFVLLPKTVYPEIAALLFILRTGLSGYTCFRCIEYIRGKSGALALCLSCCYALIGYEVAYNQIIDWHFFIVITPVIALLIERAVREKKYLAYALVLFFSVMHFYYLGYMLCLFSGVFFLYRLYLAPKEEGVKKRGVFLRFIGASALGVGMSAFYVLPSILGASADKGGLFNLSLMPALKFNPLNLVSKFFIGSFAWNNIVDGLPILYCGVLTVVLVLVFFADSSVSRKERAATFAVMALFLAVMMFDPFDTLMHGGSPPNWFPCRYSFLVCFFAVFCASGVKTEKLSLKKAIVLSAAFAVLAAFGHLFSENIPSVKRTALTLGVALFAVWYLYLKDTLSEKKIGRLLGGALVIVVSAELLLNTVFTLGVFEYYNKADYAEFIEGWSESFAATDTEEGEFFREDKTTWRTLNDSFYLGFYGNSLFSSQADETQRLSQRLGYESNLYGRGSTAFADAFLCFKYVLSDESAYVGSQYRLYDDTHPHAIYESRYTLPLCFAADEAVLRVESESADLFDYQNSILSGLVGGGEYFFPAEYTDDFDKSPAKEGTVEVTANRAGYYYATLTAACSDGADIYVNGEERGLFGNISFSRIIDLGRLEEGETVTLRVVSRNESMALGNLSVYALDEEAFEGAYEELLACGLKDTKIKDGYVRGTVSAREGEILATTLLYSDGWKIIVNGETVKGEEMLECLLAVPLNEGENTVELRYIPKGFYAGLAVSLVSAAGLAVWAVLE